MDFIPNRIKQRCPACFAALFWLLLFFTPQSTYAATRLPPHTPVPGGIAVLQLPETIAPTDAQPSAWFQGNQIMLVKNPTTDQGGWAAIIGIPLSTSPGRHQVTVTTVPNGKQLMSFDVEPKTYQEQHITLTNKRQVNPLTSDLERIKKEKSIMVAAFKDWNTEFPPSLTLIKPTTGPYSSPFGLRRFFNEQPRKPHSGLDIAAPEGTPVRAPADAIVAVTGDYFFNGKTVLLDHGHGLVTMYCHLSQIDVAEGNRIKLNDTIGLVGKTGRVTGPHLHWSVSLNNARIDPSLLMHNAQPVSPSQP